jgi:hypothetical protein
MGELDTFNVEWNRSGFAGDRANVVRRQIKEARAWIDEALNEPRASNPVDLRPLARDPCVALCAEVQAGGQTALKPARNAAFKIRRVGADSN